MNSPRRRAKGPLREITIRRGNKSLNGSNWMWKRSRDIMDYQVRVTKRRVRMRRKEEQLKEKELPNLKKRIMRPLLPNDDDVHRSEPCPLLFPCDEHVLL